MNGEDQMGRYLSVEPVRREGKSMCPGSQGNSCLSPAEQSILGKGVIYRKEHPSHRNDIKSKSNQATVNRKDWFVLEIK